MLRIVVLSQRYVRASLVLFLVVIAFLFFKNKYEKAYDSIRGNDKPHIKIFDLKSQLEPKGVYEPIKCRKSAKLFVETTLCVHDIENDVWVSGAIWKNGLWKRQTIGKNYLITCERLS